MTSYTTVKTLYQKRCSYKIFNEVGSLYLETDASGVGRTLKVREGLNC